MTNPPLGAAAFLVWTSDGHCLHCTTRENTSRTARRWIIRDTNDVEYVGPAFSGETSPQGVFETIDEWWQEKQRSPFAGMNARSLLTRVLASDN